MAVGGEAGEDHAREREIAALKAALAEQIAKLSAQIGALTELFNRNLPPSGDGPGSCGRAVGSRRQKLR